MNMHGSMTTTGAMPSSTSDMDMGGHGDGMSHGSDMPMPMSDMVMGFFTSSRTALFSEQWTPSTGGQYAGTCVFLIVLAFLLRVLLALRPILETRLWSKSSSGKLSAASLKSSDVSDEERRLLVEQPGQTLAAVGRDVKRGWSGWKVATAASRATYELAIAGVGYLLMIAVMTMNVGYFLSVLGGIWLGAFVLGGLSYDDWFSHC